MQITCPQCTKSLGDAHIDHDANIVVCDACGAVFSTPSNRPRQFDKKATLSTIPERFTITEDDFDLRISYQHNRLFGVMFAVFAVIWNGALWAIFVPTFGWIGFESFANNDLEGLIFPLFLIPFILAGVAVAVQALTHLFNTVTVDANAKSLTIMNRPISYPFDKAIAVNTIDQIFTKQKITRGSSGTQITYQVHVKLTDGKTKKLLSQLYQPEQALFIERELERFLGIADYPVEGEYRQ